MAFPPLQQTLRSRSPLRPPLLPMSSLVGLAVPLAALSIVLLAVNLRLFGLIGWVGAIAIIALTLPAAAALALSAALTGGGALLFYVLAGGSAMSFGEQLAFGLLTLLAWGLGRLQARLYRYRAELRDSAIGLSIHESVFESLFEGNCDCVKLLAVDGTVLSINSNGLKLLGATEPAQLIGKNWLDLWGLEQKKMLEPIWQRALDMGSADFVAEGRTLAGDMRLWHNTIIGLRLQVTGEAHVLCFSRDITEMETVRRRLHSSSTQLEILLDSIEDGFMVLDGRWSVAFINRCAAQLLGRAENENLGGANFWDLLPAAADDAVAVCLRRAMEQRSVEKCRHLYYQPALTPGAPPLGIWLGITALPHPDGVSVLARDITALVAAEEQAEEQRARVQLSKDIAAFGEWSFECDSGALILSEAALALLGLDPAAPAAAHKQRVFESLHPSDRTLLSQAIVNSTIAGAALNVCARQINSATHALQFAARAVTDGNGRVVRLLGAVRTVADQGEQDQRLARAMNATRDGVWEWSPQSGATFYSERFAQLLGASREQLPPLDELLDELVHPEQREAALAALQSAAQGNAAPFDLELQLRNPIGSYEWFRLRGTGSSDEQHGARCTGALMFIQHDKDLLQELRVRDEQFLALANHMNEVFWSYDLRTGRMIYVSPAVERMYGLTVAEVMHNPMAPVDQIHPDDQPMVAERFSALADGGDNHSIDYRTVDKTGVERWVRERCYALRDEQGSALRIVGITQEITEQKNYEQQLLKAAHYDELTGLPNRKSLTALLQQKCARAGATPVEPFALLLIDLDRFKNLNDSLGHSVGDALLHQVAERLRHLLDSGATLARVGGDEFAVVADGAVYAQLIDVIMQSFAEPFALDGEQAFITASMGVALCPRDGIEPDVLLKCADVAMYRAKQGGRNNFCFFSHTMKLSSREHLALETELRTALQRDEFELFYQGKFDLAGGALLGAEALVRWRSQKRGLVSPADFIPLLEETGLILPVGEWILVQACRQVRAWYEQTGQWLQVAVNVSTIQIAHRGFGERAIEILRASDIPHHTIELEITESALMGDTAHAMQLLKNLKQAGFTIALDDFGTGYSSLSYLRKFAPDTLKIDRSFVAELAEQVNDLEIVSGIVQLAKALKIRVVAEGIETAEQQRILLGLGCHLGQGYLLGRPLPAVEFEQRLSVPRALVRRSHAPRA